MGTKWEGGQSVHGSAPHSPALLPTPDSTVCHNCMKLEAKLNEERLENRRLRAANNKLRDQLASDRKLWALELLAPIEPSTREHVFFWLSEKLYSNIETVHLVHDLEHTMQRLRRVTP